ncbi:MULTISPECIES: pseudaminic acid cytidylyltransferase [unclassified Pseudovibrio]|uniref:pseudaminic acid cytidylyltransferase n=1 Tax=unclassified Pseudovibrio TaxID=2627060 RepID=UPI0007AE93CE|nr:MULTISPECIES: pseudaminic acid cytidylyltransferase [unclassified Pseudovibrio]KZL01867.1 CMP-N,N'-diacetyllegionaminic acid synthase [Pseudovibrio sp. W74]KZL02971.1 CMP-N,N'-diacetyllegionaminic acid synthase [Pseudovibrio sp. Ad14]
MKIAVIPARGGSKRIPRKNIKEFLGVPIIHYPINAALKSGLFDRVIVSTDDDEIASIAKRLGAEVPFQRPAHLSDDHASTLDVLVHALEWAESLGEVDSICCIYATAPFVSSSDLEQSYKQFLASEADYVLSAAEFPFPIQRAFRVQNRSIKILFPEHMQSRSQDLEAAFYDAGQFYWCTPYALKHKKPIIAENSGAYLMERAKVQDIDTFDDWEFAEKLFRLL